MTMHRLLAVAALALAPAIPALAQNQNSVGLPVMGARAPDGPAAPGQPLPVNRRPVPEQAPAFPEQAGAPAAVTRTPVAAEVRTRGLDHPWGLAFIGDGRLVVAEKSGAMRVIEMASGRPTAGVRGVPRVVYGGDAGLLDVVADPDFARNRRLFFTYVEPRGEHESGIVVARARLDPPQGGNQAPMYSLSEVTTLLRVHPGLPQMAHYGARLLFDREGALFVSLGERFFSPSRDEAQSPFSLLGKVLRIDAEGRPASGNPFDRDQDAENHPRAEIWSLGHRNPQGLAINPMDGSLWAAEHGPNGGDEMNRIERGANYGWPLVAYGNNYDRSAINGGRTALEGTVQPRYVWPAAIAPGGIAFYSGDLVPEWRGNLFVAALAGEHLARLVIEGDRVVGEERLLLEQHQRIRHVAQGPDGALWVLTDDADGRLIRLAPP